ncbi:unnamed protein product, partial [Closterium sp. Naga37s-1]
EQKWIVACVFMPPLYSLTAYVSLHEPHWRLLLLLVRECYESAAIYSFAMFLISCLGGQERTIWKLSRSTYQPRQKPLPYRTAPPSHSASESTWPRGGAAGRAARQQPPQYTDSESCAREDEGYWSSTDADLESGQGEGVGAGCWESVRQEGILGELGSSGYGWRSGSAAGGDGERAGEAGGRAGGRGGGAAAAAAAAAAAPASAAVAPHPAPGVGVAAAAAVSSGAAVYVHPVPLRWLLPEWVHGQQLFQECKFGIVLYMVIKPACALLQVVFGLFGLYKEGDFSPYSLYPYATLLINLSQMYALYCIVVFYHAIGHYLAHIRPLGKFLAIKGVIFVTYWQSVIIAAAVLFLGLGSGGASPLHGLEWQDAVQDWLICVEMAAAALANHWTFPVSPYQRSRLAPARMQRLPAGVVAVLADMADPSAPLDPEEILASEVIGRSLFTGSTAAAAGMGGEGGGLGRGRIGDGRDRRGGGMGAGGDAGGRGGSGVEGEWNAGGSGGLAGALAAASRVVGAPFRRDRREDAWEYASDYLGRRDMEVSEKIHDVFVGGGTDAFQDMQAAVQRGMQPISAAVEPLTAAVQPFSAAVTSAHQQVASTWHQLQASLPALPAAFLPAVANSRGNVRDGGAGERSGRVQGRGVGGGGCGADGKSDLMGAALNGSHLCNISRLTALTTLSIGLPPMDASMIEADYSVPTEPAEMPAVESTPQPSPDPYVEDYPTDMPMNHSSMGPPVMQGSMDDLSCLVPLTRLQTLTLANLNLTAGELPSSLSALTSLTHLDLSFLRITRLPQWISSLSKLAYLDVTGNLDVHRTAPFPTEWMAFTGLVSLQAGLNGFTGSIPSTISALTNLTDLDVRDNQLNASLPDSISRLASLQHL